MWAGVPSEPLCLHTQSLATAHIQFNLIQYIQYQFLIKKLIQYMQRGLGSRPGNFFQERRAATELLIFCLFKYSKFSTHSSNSTKFNWNLDYKNRHKVPKF
eukprot:TRINITY_DN1063_c1_g1_i2.p9 TRINITY_DN1063_c1_g1~~TRINITY_DN1063_c1_g1_i2.p9  ORF type:complete len:101 (+),score=5.35 TRINITY_DN1063_c1_g1_i2:576-878(+)